MFQKMLLHFLFLQPALPNKIDVTSEVALVDPEVNLQSATKSRPVAKSPAGTDH